MAIAGHTTQVFVLASAGTPDAGDEIDGINSATFSPSRDMLDRTDFKDGDARRKLAGLKDGSISLSGDAEMEDPVQDLIRSAFDNGTTVQVYIHFAPGAASGSKGYTAQCLVENYEIGSSYDDKVSFSASLTFDGAPTAV